MKDIFCRTEAMLGKDAMEKLKSARVALFGLGGVGSAAFEALVRSGVGQIDVFDHDTLSESNLNRQLLATADLIGTDKVEAAVKRADAISSYTKIIPHKLFFLPDTSEEIDMRVFDYIIDAVDTVTGKLEIISKAKRVMRKELKNRGITDLPVVWSDEKPFCAEPTGELKGNRPAPASAIFVPAAAGLILAAEAVKAIISL